MEEKMNEEQSLEDGQREDDDIDYVEDREELTEERIKNMLDAREYKELKEELDNWLIQQRKSEFKKILKQESNQEKSDDEIEEILNVLDEVKDLKNKSFRNSDQLLKDAIEELD